MRESVTVPMYPFLVDKYVAFISLHLQLNMHVVTKGASNRPIVDSSE